MPDILDKWLHLLETSDNQCLARLVDGKEGKLRYCPIGLLLTLLDQFERVDLAFRSKVTGDAYTHSVVEDLGILSGEQIGAIMDMNDSGYYSFKDIAAYVRRSMEGAEWKTTS